MAEPVCPTCNLSGVQNFASKDSQEKSRNGEPWYMIVHCNGCGHVYGVFPKHVFSQTTHPKLVLPKNT